MGKGGLLGLAVSLGLFFVLVYIALFVFAKTGIKTPAGN